MVLRELPENFELPVEYKIIEDQMKMMDLKYFEENPGKTMYERNFIYGEHLSF